MGNRIFAKFLIAIPLSVSVATGSAINEDKTKDNLETNTKIYDIAPKFEGTGDKITLNGNSISFRQTGGLNNKMSRIRVEDKLPQQSKAKIILAKAENFGNKEVKVVREDAKKKIQEDYQTVSDEQMKVMEKMVAGTPIAQMLPYIKNRRPETAAFLVSIAKKESNWGKISPRTSNSDCFNYWGFKDRRFKFVAGHSCFPSAQVAVETVGNRIDKLVDNGRNTPQELVIWKCGSACGSDKNAAKWISDVNLYFRPIVAAAS